MSKLPKKLSSIRARSSSLANKSLPWSERTSIRSGSNILAALVDSGARLPMPRNDSPLAGDHRAFWVEENGKKREATPFEVSLAALMRRIERETKRIKKKIGTENPQGHKFRTPEIEAYVLHKQAVINTLLFKVENLFKKKEEIDKREMTKSKNKLSVANLEQVKLEKGYAAYENKPLAPENVFSKSKPGYYRDIEEKRKTIAQLVKEERLKKKVYAPEIQKEIDKVFTKEEIEREYIDDQFSDLDY